MKVEINEHTWDLSVSLTPETVEETAMLLRYANNAKKVKPDVYFNFSKANTYLNIRLNKVRESVQQNSISK